MSFKEILIFVAGTIPQIITETIYVLSLKVPPVYPDEIFIITTSTGRKRIEGTLLKHGVLKGLVREYSLPDIKLTRDSFIIVRDTTGRRKTMSFYLGSALQLFGRPWDKLSHILVTPEFETNAPFFYKPKKNRLIECRLTGGITKRLNTKDAEIYLTDKRGVSYRGCTHQDTACPDDYIYNLFETEA